jgi:hypothetical protein
MMTARNPSVLSVQIEGMIDIVRVVVVLSGVHGGGKER